MKPISVRCKHKFISIYLYFRGNVRLKVLNDLNFDFVSRITRTGFQNCPQTIPLCWVVYRVSFIFILSSMIRGRYLNGIQRFISSIPPGIIIKKSIIVTQYVTIVLKKFNIFQNQLIFPDLRSNLSRYFNTNISFVLSIFLSLFQGNAHLHDKALSSS